MILKDLAIGEFLIAEESALYNTNTVTFTPTAATTLLPGQPVSATAIDASDPIGICTESITLAANEAYGLGIIQNGFGVVLDGKKLADRYPTLYPAANTALAALGFVVK
jgi:hypothetical protein